MKRMLSTLFGTLAIATTVLTTGIEVGNPTKPKPTFAEVGGSSSSGGTQAPKRTLAGGTEVGNGSPRLS